MTEWTKITAIVPADAAALFGEAARLVLPGRDLAVFVASPPEQRTSIVNGIVLEALVANYLAGPHPPTEAP